ncbi:HAD family hydrolase [Alicyclobacillus curvatus]|nr:HAD family hydrolase [Alicyclobacillus curvatus]
MAYDIDGRQNDRMENYIVDNVQLLLFDLDDTLFDYDLCWEYGVKAALAKHGLTKDLEQESLYATFVKHDGALWRQFTDGLLSLPEQRVQRFQNTLRDFGMFPSEEHAVSFQELFIELHTAYITPDMMVTNIIADLSKRFRLGIVTNGGPEQWTKVSKLELEGYFPPETIFASDVLGCSKPNRRIFDLALTHFNIESDCAIFVGDSWENDVVGSVEAGLRAIWLNRRNHRASTNHQPLATIHSLSELPNVIAALKPT